MFEIIYTKSYQKRAAKFLKKNPGISEQYLKTLKLLSLNPKHPGLRLHKLKGKLSKLYSVSINIFFRITLYFRIEKNQIVLVDIGSHDEVY